MERNQAALVHPDDGGGLEDDAWFWIQRELAEAYRPDQVRGPDGRWVKMGGALRQNLEAMSRMTPGFMSANNYVLERGEEFKPRPLPKEEEHLRGPVGQCYKNAIDVALGMGGRERREDLRYVEGFALPNIAIGIPIRHGWLVDPEGNVLDVTWPEVGLEYIGVPFSDREIRETALRTGQYGMLGSRNLPFLREGEDLGALRYPPIFAGDRVLVWDGRTPFIADVRSVDGPEARIALEGREESRAVFLCQRIDPFTERLEEGHGIRAAFDEAKVIRGKGDEGGQFVKKYDLSVPKAERGKGDLYKSYAERLVPKALRRDDGRTISGESVPPQLKPPDSKDHPAVKKLGGGYHVLVPEEGERDGMIGLGIDSKGRVKRVYSDAFEEGKAREKFIRVLRLTAVLPEVDKRMLEDSARSDIAAAALLVRVTGMRPGSEADRGGAKKAYGASTLEGRHLVVKGDEVRLQFTGKGGKELDIPVTDPRVAALLRERAKGKKKDEQLFPGANENKLNAYLKGVAGDEFKMKDLRTALATALAKNAVKLRGVPDTVREAKAARLEIARQISEQLGNSPAEALKSYIAPECFADWVFR